MNKIALIYQTETEIDLFSGGAWSKFMGAQNLGHTESYKGFEFLKVYFYKKYSFKKKQNWVIRFIDSFCTATGLIKINS